ncbi:MAG: DUF1887 family CARF protein [Nitrospirota bacterium]
MSHIHVCLVSDQPIPNVLSIYHFKPDELLFITTEEMERKRKVDSILDALNTTGMDYLKKAEKVIVKEDSILDCHKKLEEWIKGREDSEFVLNLTCGTKIMSIAAYEYFKDYSSRMIYIPLPKNEFIIPFPKKTPGKVVPLNLRLDVRGYLTAYGLRILNAGKLASNQAAAQQRRNLSEWIVRSYDKIKPLLERLSEKLRKHRDDRREFEFITGCEPKLKKEEELLQKLGFSYARGVYGRTLNQSEVVYITGGWLEEFCFNELLKFKGKGIDDLVLGIIPQNALGRNNEFDIMFTKDNALYTVECKSLDQKDDTKTEALYKIAALQKDFGLRVESFFVSTSPYILKDGKLKTAVRARAEQFKTTVIPPGEVLNFGKKVAERLGLNG